MTYRISLFCNSRLENACVFSRLQLVHSLHAMLVVAPLSLALSADHRLRRLVSQQYLRWASWLHISISRRCHLQRLLQKDS